MNSKILMIDKNVNESRKLKINLENLDYRVFISKDVQEGRLIANANNVDIILIFDINAEIKLLKSEKLYSDIPIMAVIPSEQNAKIDGAKELLDDFVFIPYDKEQVYLKIKNLVRIKELLDIIKQKDQELQILRKRLGDTSLVDEATGLYNTFYLKHIIAKECVSSDRYGYRISSIALDVDSKFHKDNSSSILKEIAQTIKSIIRQDDTLVRLDSGEFYIFLPHTGIKDAVFVANKVKGLIEKSVFSTGEKITVSAGVASSDEIERGYKKEDEIIGQTLAALKRAQAGGDSRVECY